MYDPYNYTSIPIPGGGFVTGFVFHPNVPGICYARTDVGGIYRLDFLTHRWEPLMDWVAPPHEGLMQALSIALDPERPSRIMVLAGNEWPGWKIPGGSYESALLISEDYGKTWEIRPVPFMVNGNGPSRSCAEKLAYANKTLYFASPNEGLFMSKDLGKTWVSIPVPNPHLVFVKADPNGRWLLISSTGEPENKKDALKRAHSLYISIDGETFSPLPLPAWPEDSAQIPAGYVAVSCAVSQKCENIQQLYVTLSAAGRPMKNLFYWNFCCECGGGTNGKLLRYTLKTCSDENNSERTLVPKSYEDLTPDIPRGAGMCGIAVAGDLIYCSTINEKHNYIYRSVDGGKHFTCVLDPKDTGVCDYTVPYMKPCYNDDLFLVHWMSCLTLDPFNPDFLLINSGTGVFACTHATKATSPRFIIMCDGLEETVHLNLYAPPSGPVQLLDIVGDLGGFAFTDITSPCENSFADNNGDRYITCNNADYTDFPVDLKWRGKLYKNIVPFISTARGNWRGVTKGGLILSLNHCESFVRLPMPLGLSPELDEVCRCIEQPNVNAGWCAMSSDARAILWTPAKDWFHLPASLAVRTEDFGQSYSFVEVYDLDGRQIKNSVSEIKFFSDRLTPDWFYGFGEASQVYISTDKGRTFFEVKTPEDFPKDFYFSGVDGMKKGEIRIDPEKAGSIWVAADEYGLWHLSFDGENLKAMRITEGTDSCLRVGLGKGLTPNSPTLFIAGIICGIYGLYKKPSPDSPWIRINDSTKQFGHITSISGDMNREGLVYVATGGRGILAGKPSEKNIC